MKNVISFGEVLECNGFLTKRGLGFRIHLRDACGKQSFYIEPQNGEGGGPYEEIHDALSEFFGNQGFQLEFSDDGLNFWLDGQ